MKHMGDSQTDFTEEVKLNKSRSTPKAICLIIPFMWYFRKNKTVKSGNRAMVSRRNGDWEG